MLYFSGIQALGTAIYTNYPELEGAAIVPDAVGISTASPSEVDGESTTHCTHSLQRLELG
jgi:hypothetical protein